MLLQRYYNIGKGVIQPYGNVRFTSSNSVIVSFTSTSEVSFQPPSKKRVDRSLCTLLFCTEYGCGQVLKNSIDYENHQLQGCQLSFGNIFMHLSIYHAFIYISNILQYSKLNWHVITFCSATVI